MRRSTRRRKSRDKNCRRKRLDSRSRSLSWNLRWWKKRRVKLRIRPIQVPTRYILWWSTTDRALLIFWDQRRNPLRSLVTRTRLISSQSSGKARFQSTTVLTDVRRGAQVASMPVVTKSDFSILYFFLHRLKINWRMIAFTMKSFI